MNHVAPEKLPALQRVPHPTFRAGPRYAYSGEKNDQAIREILDEHVDSREPFFVFSNYMETHRPYVADEGLRRKHMDEPVSWDELVRLNEEVAESWNFVKLTEEEKVDEDDLRKLRSLYAAEVEKADRHLGVLLDDLDRRDVLDDTLVVVTSDHGEMLGEEDAFGRRRFGHQGGIGEELARVPLVVAHPDLEGRDVEEYVSLKDLYSLVLSFAREGSGQVDDVTADDGVLCEYPALGDDVMYEKRPEVPEDAMAERVSRDSVSGYLDDWMLSMDSDGREAAERDGEQAKMEECPENLVDLVDDALEQLSALEAAEVDDATQERLEELGYM